MKRQTISRTCHYCQNTFEANRTTARYCSGTCKTYASQERTGRRKPAAAPGIGEAPDPELQAARRAQAEAAHRRLAGIWERFERDLEAAEKEVRQLRAEVKQMADREPAEVQALQHRVLAAEKKVAGLRLRCDRMVFEEARARQECFDQTLPNIWRDGKVSGRDIGLFAEHRVRYHFERMQTSCNLQSLGSPARPFICYVCEGGSEYRYHMEAVLELAGEIAARSDAPILVVVDRQIMVRGFEESLKKNGLARENVTLKFAENRADIEAEMGQNEYEFAVFPDLSAFNLDYDFLFGLTKQHPRTSIFCASEKPLPDFLQRNRLNIRLRTGWEPVGMGGILVSPHSDYLFMV